MSKDGRAAMGRMIIGLGLCIAAAIPIIAGDLVTANLGSLQHLKLAVDVGFYVLLFIGLGVCISAPLAK